MEGLSGDSLNVPVVLCMDASNLRHMGPLVRSIRANIPHSRIYLMLDLLVCPEWADDVKVLDRSWVTDQSVRWVNFMGWGRFFIHDLWPELDRCIYLDYDTVVLQDISDLLSPRTGWLLKAAYHDTTLFNSGVLAFNFTQECLERLGRCKSMISASTHDQEVLQALFGDAVTFIDVAYNCCISGLCTLCSNPKVVHFCGPQKPWQISSLARYYFEYC